METAIDLLAMRHVRAESNAAYKRSTQEDESDYTPEFRARSDSLYRATEPGIEQGVIAGQWLIKNFIPQYGPFDVHIASGFNRTIETAGYLGLPGARWKTDIAAHERSWGDLVGRPKCENETLFSGVLARREMDPLYTPLPNGESIAESCLRARLFLDYLRWKHPGKRVLLVTHGEFLWSLRIEIERLSPWQFREMYTSGQGQFQNCEMLHYSRRDPTTGAREDDFEWMRRINPLDSSVPAPWQPIERRLWTNEEMIKEAERTKRLVHR